MGDIDNVRERLKKISLFKEISKNQDYMEKLINICRTRRYKSGETIIKEGDIGSEMFVVLSGGVEILKRTRAGDNYTVVSLKADDNVFFGELALIDDDKRSATVLSAMDSEFLIISKSDFLSLGNDNPFYRAAYYPGNCRNNFRQAKKNHFGYADNL